MGKPAPSADARITVEDAQEMIVGPLATREIGRHRWYQMVEVVAQHPEHGLVMFFWMRPATEEQEGQDQYDLDENGMVEVVLVEEYEETIVRLAYRPREVKA